jgi:eukaryotic-like serine/threonine-protein kinase
MSENVRVLNGRYEVESRLGEGGMAKVFAGTDRLLGRKVAVKVLSSQYAQDKTFVERFRREAQAAAGLNHPNVVSVFDTGSDDGVHYIVMEHVEGRTLAHIIGEEGALRPARAVEIAVDVCRALSSAHEKGMVHRDVKPGNILLTPDGGVKVADFGIARVASGEPLTVTGSVIGTASYLSPEQASGGSIDARSDIYSLGCVLYEMLTGKTPFAGDSLVSIAYKHVEEEPTAPSLVNPAVPAGLSTVVTKAMAKDPADRYQSADEMAGELREASADAAPAKAVPTNERTEVLPVSPGGPTTTAPLPVTVSRERGRRGWPLATAAVVLAVLALAVALILGRDDRLPVSRPSLPPVTSPPVTSSPSPSPSPTAVALSVDEALAGLTQTVEAAAGVLGDEAVEEILNRVDDAFNVYREDGNLEEALLRLGELEGAILAEMQVGDIAVETGNPIVEGIRALAVAMQADPPQVEEDGPGRGKGKGKGQGGGEGDED